LVIYTESNHDRYFLILLHWYIVLTD